MEKERIMAEKKRTDHKERSQAGMEQPEDQAAMVDPEQEVMVDEPQLVEVRSQLEEAIRKRDEYLDGWQRALAEFSNFRKRVEREREQVQQNAAGNIIRRFLDVLDDLDRALKNRPKEGEGALWAEGIELVYRKLLNIIEAEGVRPMEAEGQQFDPNLHEAISHEASPAHESGEVIEVIQNGYLIGDRVLKPARVRVAR
jgi:molecular chaperone GrpE